MSLDEMSKNDGEWWTLGEMTAGKMTARMIIDEMTVGEWTI